MQSEWCNETCETQTTILRSGQSTSWLDAGIYSIPGVNEYISDYDDISDESEVTTRGIWGVDSVYLEPFARDVGFSRQYVVGVTRKIFYVGTFGLAIGSISPPGGSLSTYMSALYAAKAIPNQSFGYTAGSEKSTNQFHQYPSLVNLP
jgi:hypothetical protein